MGINQKLLNYNIIKVVVTGGPFHVDSLFDCIDISSLSMEINMFFFQAGVVGKKMKGKQDGLSSSCMLKKYVERSQKKKKEIDQKIADNRRVGHFVPWTRIQIIGAFGVSLLPAVGVFIRRLPATIRRMIWCRFIKCSLEAFNPFNPFNWRWFKMLATSKIVSRVSLNCQTNSWCRYRAGYVLNKQ